jgi:acetyltransferase-like isoleucine patch superfamily enzyme
MKIKEWISTRYILRAINDLAAHFFNYLFLNSKIFFRNSFIYPGTKIYGAKNIKISRDVAIRENCYLNAPKGGFINIGEDVFIGMFCVIDGTGGVDIGNGVAISYHCRLVSSSHIYDDIFKPSGEQGLTRKGIKIEDNVWLGANVTVLDGITVGEGAVVGAGSVVTQDIPRFAIAVGVPAKVIKYKNAS